MDRQSIYINITDLLVGRNWKKTDSHTKYDVFMPPSALDFDSNYRLYVYNKFENLNYDKEIIKNLDIISQIYQEDIDELYSIVVEDKQILSFHFEDDSIKNGKPSIPFFSSLISKSKDLLQEIANFSVIQKPHFFENSEESERYLNYCNFFKNQTGSLITKIQLPNKEEIREKTIFETAIIGNQINHNLINVMNFINEEIIAKDNFEPNNDFIIQNKALISVNVANKLKDLYMSVNCVDTEIVLKGTKINKVSSTKDLNKEKVNKLNTFSKTIREKMKEISENEVYGKIIKLQSKDVNGDKNTVTVEGQIKNIKSSITVQLNSEQIKLAADAFKNNKTVCIHAILEKEKSQYKVEKLNYFSVLSK